MRIRRSGRAPPARCSLNQSKLEQIRLVDVFDGLGGLAHADGQRGQTDRATAEAALVLGQRQGDSAKMARLELV